MVFTAWLTVRVAAVALAFSKMTEPGAALVARLAMVMLLPLSWSLVPTAALAPKARVLGEPLLIAPALASWRMPSLTVTPPVKVLLPPSVRVPVPVLIRPSAPAPFWMRPEKLPLLLLAPAVKVIAPAWLLVMVPEPVKPLTVMLRLLRSRVPLTITSPLLTPEGTAPVLPIFRMPAEIRVFPE